MKIQSKKKMLKLLPLFIVELVYIFFLNLQTQQTPEIDYTPIVIPSLVVFSHLIESLLIIPLLKRNRPILRKIVQYFLLLFLIGLNFFFGLVISFDDFDFPIYVATFLSILNCSLLIISSLIEDPSKKLRTFIKSLFAFSLISYLNGLVILTIFPSMDNFTINTIEISVLTVNLTLILIGFVVCEIYENRRSKHREAEVQQGMVRTENRQEKWEKIRVHRLEAKEKKKEDAERRRLADVEAKKHREAEEQQKQKELEEQRQKEAEEQRKLEELRLQQEIQQKVDKINGLFALSESVKMGTLSQHSGIPQANLTDFLIRHKDRLGAFRIDGDTIKIQRKSTVSSPIYGSKHRTPPNQVISPVGEAQQVEKSSDGLKIFLSYATVDADLFKIPQIVAQLERMPGIGNVLFWQEDMRDNIIEYMNDNLGDTDVVLLFCSPNSLNSTPVSKEWTAADAMNIPILPIFLKSDHIPPLLRSRLGVEYDAFDFDKVIQEIYQLILKKEIG